MAGAKFKPTEKSVERLIGEVAEEKVRDDCYELVWIMKKVTGPTRGALGREYHCFG